MTLRFWNVGDAYDAVMYRKIAQKFEKETGVKVIVQPISWGQFYTKYLTAMAAGDPPDIVTGTHGSPGDYGSVGGLVDLQEMFPKESAELRQRIFDGPWNMYYFQGHLFGIPHGMTSSGLFYRKDIFAKLGIKPPKTWSDMDEVIRVLEANRYLYTFDFTRDAAWAMGQFVIPLGTDVYLYKNNDGTRDTKVNWLDPRFNQGFKHAIRVWNNHNINLTKGVELFVSDEKEIAAPMLIDGLWDYMEIERRAPAMKGRWGVVPMPAADNGQAASVLGGTGFVIFRKSKHPKEAMQWIMFNYRKDIQTFDFYDNLTSRGEARGLYLSPLKEFWDQSIPELPKEDQDSLRQILERTRTSIYSIGGSGAQQLLDKSISQFRNTLRDYLQGVAKKNNVSLFDLHVGFAQGKYQDDYQKFIKYEDKLIDDKLVEITPQANQSIADRQAEYNKYFVNINDRLPALEKKKNIMFYAKCCSCFAILCYLGFILFYPGAKKYWHSYIYITPAVISLLVFLLIPMIVSIYIAFTTYNPLLPLSTADWIGLKNFKDILFDKSQIFSDPAYSNLSILGRLFEFLKQNDLWISLIRSVKFAVIVIPIQLFIAVLLAVGLDKKLKPDRMYKFVYFSPLVTSVVSVALIWTVLFLGAKYGWINSLVLSLGLTRDPIDFLHNSNTFLNSVILMSIWQGLAFVILIYLAGLQNIPRELYEAAEIDGANAIQKFFRITIVLLKPQILFLTVIGIIGSLQVFEQIYILGGGAGEAGSRFGPGDSGMTVVCYLYRKGFEDFQMGQASAVAYILFAIIFVLTYINWKWLLGRNSDES